MLRDGDGAGTPRHFHLAGLTREVGACLAANEDAGLYLPAMTLLLHIAPVLLLLGLGMGYSYRAGKLTGAAVWTGGGLGLLIFLGAGYLGLALLALFFALGTAATAWRAADKRRLGLAEENRGRRTAGAGGGQCRRGRRAGATELALAGLRAAGAAHAGR